MCPMCVVVGWVGGLAGGYFGINPPESLVGRRVSAGLIGTLTTLTFIFLKVKYNMPLCIDGKFNINNIVWIISRTAPLGVIYSIGINYILKRTLFFTEKKEESEEIKKPCCCAGK